MRILKRKIDLQKMDKLFNSKRMSEMIIKEKEFEFLKIPTLYEKATQEAQKHAPFFIELEQKFCLESIEQECENYYDSEPFLKLRLKCLYILR